MSLGVHALTLCKHSRHLVFCCKQDSKHKSPRRLNLLLITPSLCALNELPQERVEGHVDYRGYSNQTRTHTHTHVFAVLSAPLVISFHPASDPVNEDECRCSSSPDENTLTVAVTTPPSLLPPCSFTLLLLYSVFTCVGVTASTHRSCVWGRNAKCN